MGKINHIPNNSGSDRPPDEPIDIIKAIREKGYASDPAGRLNLSQFSDRGRLFTAFETNLDADPNPGRRWRSYGRVKLNRHTGRIAAQPPVSYFQSEETNWHDGGKQRSFRPIQPSLMTGPTLRYILERNLSIAAALFEDIARNPTPIAGVHFISYRPDGGEASFASPWWLHRDDERFVSVTILSVSDNLGGGENVISSGNRKIDDMINMRSSMDTLFLTQKPAHAVQAMYTKDGYPAHRDIILTTFD